LLTLRPYQVEAVEQIVDRGNQLLALVMGAGKTAVAVRAVRQLRRERRVDRGVVFALKSTKYQWEREIHRFDPRATVQVVEGDKYQREKALRQAHNFNYTILHYECLVNDWALMGKLPIDFIILDEITAIKSFDAKRSRRAKILGKRSQFRIGLSGQPVENRPEELFSIMEFIDPEVLGPFPKFDQVFITRDYWGKPKSYKNLGLIAKRMNGVMYRKSREDIAEWLPEMIETEVPVHLDRLSWRLHELVRADLKQAIDDALAAGVSGRGFDLLAHYGHTDERSSHQLMGTVMSRMLAMRMLSSHPLLLRESGKNFDDPASAKGSEYASTLKAAGLLDNIPKYTTKFVALIDRIEEILDEDPSYKVVVFSFFKPMLTLIQGECHSKKWGLVRVDGDVSAADRDVAIQSFNNDPATRIFLSSDAGAYGISLGAGSHLICYDLPWSAGALAQRVARIDRTDSVFKQIQITYLYAANTIEERMLAMLQQKRKVSRAFLDKDFDPKTGTIDLNLESLREFVE
jgi:SNF2 family DNA or RNA helicase